VGGVSVEVKPLMANPYSDAPTDTRLRLVDGASFILDTLEQVPAVWGDGQIVAWAAGEPCLLVGPPGVGKTTIAQQLALTRHGVFRRQEFLGMPVAIDPRLVLYVAAERPRQAARSMRRMVAEEHRKALESLFVWSGPLPFDVAQEPERLREMAEALGVGTVVIDSLKDVALDLSKDETGSRVNLALQHLVSAGIEVLALHHQRKDGAGGAKPRTLADVYGSAWITAGAGSVLLLWGEAGDPIVDLVHLKQPAEEIGPLTLLHDHERGSTTLYDPVDLYVLVQAATNGGVTVADAARHLYGTPEPDRNQLEKARRKLEDLARRGEAHRVEGSKPKDPVHYRPIERREA
jgi:replicative DNA helicase